jgi:hypothetical protein
LLFAICYLLFAVCYLLLGASAADARYKNDSLLSSAAISPFMLPPLSR